MIQNTSVALTDLGFGASAIGDLYRVTPVEEATAAVDAAWEAGIRYFDTAPHSASAATWAQLCEGARGASTSSPPR